MHVAEPVAGYRDIPEEQLSRLWGDYAERRDDATRETLIETYSGLARMIAAKLYANRHIREIEFEEYFHYAFVGLIEAVDRFDPMQGASFQTYATIRITGEVLSGIENHCERQQQITFRARLRKERARAISSDDGDKGTSKSLFEKLADIAVGLAIGYMLEDSGMYQGDEPQSSRGGYERVEFLELRDIIRRLVELLPEQQKIVVKYHYYYAYNTEKIGEALGVTKGRVSQIHKQALRELRLLYRQYGELDRSV